ncbi:MULTISPECIES: nuclear transport factor 2 family protein [Actinosynnema]|uniref:nuclear transport factor 2 family protein n=1 Tax=Actinosynnema TaxID=40566 RepID=UPI0020A3CE69|nr:nuclear transport factor 2 family protein [Actinosynnema pretiosum]MCP2095687.1 hypothetical protein [Actinosynnema pretiosum]
MTYTPSDEDYASVLDWFARWDALCAERDVEALADMAMFPVNAVTGGSAESWDRERFLRDFGAILGDGDVELRSTRTPLFLGADLVFVVTDAEYGSGAEAGSMRYGDLLVRRDGRWLYQTMAQSGW